ncbi:hypothetical protein VNO80_14311 [Phaseolus coccineus]|uniref:Uncharacterized protein n=1 Tax=Phaseolus coccineus TaxID=3886 RepID=A0AAN9MI59_PHACN
MGMNPDAAAHYFSEEPEASTYIDSAFRSSSTNEVYFFLHDKYVRLYYTPGQSTQTDDKILRDLDWICYDFPSLEGSSFAAYGIGCSFDTEGYKAYIFSECYCTNDSKQLIDPIRNITDGFPVLKGTIFEDGIDACFASHKENEAYLFKEEKYALINFIDNTFVDDVKLIVDGWSSLKDILPLGNPNGDPYPQKVGTNRYRYRSIDEEKDDEL